MNNTAQSVANSDQKKIFVSDIINILKVNLGNYGAQMYEEYYMTLDKQTVIESAAEILHDIIGPQATKLKLGQIASKYSLDIKI